MPVEFGLASPASPGDHRVPVGLRSVELAERLTPTHPYGAAATAGAARVLVTGSPPVPFSHPTSWAPTAAGGSRTRRREGRNGGGVHTREKRQRTRTGRVR
eukprot:gene13227-biopygen23029